MGRALHPLQDVGRCHAGQSSARSELRAAVLGSAITDTLDDWSDFINATASGD